MEIFWKVNYAFRDVFLETQRRIWPHDGATLHFSSSGIKFLNKDYRGRYGLMAWLAPSPDLNRLHFFLWGCMKLKLYHGGKLEAGHQLVEAIDESGCMQWQSWHPCHFQCRNCIPNAYSCILHL
jgi:hypothetical protein